MLLPVSACAAVLAAGPSPAAAAQWPIRVRGLLCQRAVDPAKRVVSITAVMRPVPGTRAMSIRFTLLARPGAGAPVSAIHGGDLGTWLSPVGQANLGRQPDDVWVVNHPVADLPAPAVYRYRVAFRWTGARGRVLAIRTRQSTACVQPELRPDLLVRSITVAPIPGRPRLVSYTAQIRNAGATAAGMFQVGFSSGDGLVSKVHLVGRLAARTTRRVTFVGPTCTAGTAPTIKIDPLAVEDLDPADNALTVPPACPAVTVR